MGKDMPREKENYRVQRTSTYSFPLSVKSVGRQNNSCNASYNIYIISE